MPEALLLKWDLQEEVQETTCTLKCEWAEKSKIQEVITLKGRSGQNERKMKQLSLIVTAVRSLCCAIKSVA